MKDRIRERMPNQWWSFLQNARSSLQNQQPRLFGRFPFTTRLYYGISSKFAREMNAVMAGRVAMTAVRGPGLKYRLRRNIHRIEKGLISRPRRANFAVSYIAETVEILDLYLRGDESSNEDPLTVWATGVLSSYFSANAPHPAVDEAREGFESLRHVARPRLIQASPYLRPVTAVPPVDYAQFYELALRRRSVRWYVGDAVPRELVDRAIAAAAQAPSACNRQPFVFKVFDDPVLVRKIARVPGGAAGFAQGFTGIIVLVGDMSAFRSEGDRHLIYIDSSLAAMAFMLGAETLGFSTCPLNWPDFRQKERELQRIIGLEPFQRPIMLIAYGYPDPEGFVACSIKRPLSELRTYNEAK